MILDVCSKLSVDNIRMSENQIALNLSFSLMLNRKIGDMVYKLNLNHVNLLCYHVEQEYESYLLL